MIETARPVVAIAGSQTTYQLTGKKEIVFERTYDAPPERVFAAFCDPKLVPQWWGSVGAKLVVETMDVRPGGKWRFTETDAKGKKSVFHGEYKDVVPPTRIVSTFRYGGGIMGASCRSKRPTSSFPSEARPSYASPRSTPWAPHSTA